MQPFFGTTLQDSLFEQNDDELKSSIRESITEAVNFWLPYIAITELNVESVLAVGNSKEEHGVTISMKVSINGAQSEIPITFLVTSSTIEQI
jgi:phage baseplate assembly protein W